MRLVRWVKGEGKQAFGVESSLQRPCAVGRLNPTTQHMAETCCRALEVGLNEYDFGVKREE